MYIENPIKLVQKTPIRNISYWGFLRYFINIYINKNNEFR